MLLFLLIGLITFAFRENTLTRNSAGGACWTSPQIVSTISDALWLMSKKANNLAGVEIKVTWWLVVYAETCHQPDIHSFKASWLWVTTISREMCSFPSAGDCVGGFHDVVKMSIWEKFSGLVFIVLRRFNHSALIWIRSGVGKSFSWKLLGSGNFTECSIWKICYSRYFFSKFQFSQIFQPLENPKNSCKYFPPSFRR